MISPNDWKQQALTQQQGTLPWLPVEHARDALTASEVKTKHAAGVLKTLGVTGKAVLVDAQLDEKFALSVRNIDGVSLVQSNRVTARDVANTRQVVLTRAAVEKLEATLAARPERAKRVEGS